MRQRVFITGLGCVSPFGTGIRALKEAILEGRTGVRPLPYDTAACRSHSMATVGEFDPTQFIDPMKLRRIDEVGRMALVAGRLALEDAGLADAPDEVRDRTGVILGSMTAGAHSTVEYFEALHRRGPIGVSAMSFSNTVGNAAASLCGIEYRLRGPNVTMSYKEASALSAIGYAANLIEHGRATALLSGAVDGVIEIFFRAHDTFHVLSPTDRGEEVARPFDRRRNGFILGEGGYLMVLESAASAERRDARVYGEVLGVAGTSSPAGLNDWPETHDDMTRAIRQALAEAQLNPADVAAVMATANGSRRLDVLEAQALADVFGPRRVPVASIKGAVGDAGAAGAASVAAALTCVADGLLPPTAGFGDPDPDCPVDASGEARAIPARSRAPLGLDGRVVLVNTFASGGACFSAVIRVRGGAGLPPSASA